jgi:hypothetical protein
MRDDFEILGRLGYKSEDDPFRATKDGHEFENLMPAPQWHTEVIKLNGSVDDVLSEMRKVIRKYAWQTKALSGKLKGKTTYETCQNVWQFLYDHFKYHEDDDGQEIRTPAVSWAVRRTRGIACDDFSVFAGTIFYNLGIPFYERAAHYPPPEPDRFSHVYDAVPDAGKSYIVVDGVLDQFDTEKKAIETKDYLVMSNKLNGVKISVLSGFTDEDTEQQLLGIITAENLPGGEEMGAAPSHDEELEAMYKHLVQTRDLIEAHPETISSVEDTQSFLKMLNYAIQYWNTDKRDEALAILEEKESEINDMNGLSGVDDHEETELYYGVEGFAGVSILGKAKVAKKFFSKLKEAANKTGAALKTAFKQVVRYSPTAVKARVGLLLALRLNILKMAEHLKWGYLTEEEAKQKGFDHAEWLKLKDKLTQAEDMFIKVLQGDGGPFKDAILKGRAGGLSGFSESLGEPVTLATASTLASALPFIKKILDLLKGVDFSKLIKNVDPAMLKKAAAITAEAAKAISPEDAKAIDDIEQQVNNNIPDNNDTTDAGDNGDNGNNPDAGNNNGGDNKRSKASAKNNALPATTNKDQNLPATTNNNTTTAPPLVVTPTPNDSSIFDTLSAWVKENKTPLLITGSCAVGLYLISKAMKKNPALSGTKRKGKKKTGKKKNNPPKALSGTKKKKGKGKRGGGPKKITL